jgi:hypothetical protein
MQVFDQEKRMALAGFILSITKDGINSMKNHTTADPRFMIKICHQPNSTGTLSI